MAVITNYTTLSTAIGDYLARSDLTSFIPNFIQNMEERFYRDPKNWGSWMETAYTGQTTAGKIAVPNDFLAWKVLYVNTSKARKLEAKTLAALYDKYPRGQDTGFPAWFARNGAYFEFGPIPDSNYDMAGTYFGKPTVLRTDSDGANWLTTNAPDLLLYGSLLEAEVFLKNDPRLVTWQAFYDGALRTYREYLRATDLSGGPLQAAVG